MVIGYADNNPRGAMATGESGSDGRYEWRVEPAVPAGTAKVLVTTTGPDWSREGCGNAEREFAVPGAKGC